jgi:hypothetical protein
MYWAFFNMSNDIVAPLSSVGSFYGQFADKKNHTNNIVKKLMKGSNKLPETTKIFRNDDVFRATITDAKMGDIKLSDLVGKFLSSNKFKPILKLEQDDFLFAVVDHNSAHHMSYILSRRALARATTPAKAMVINFDMHEDFGGGGTLKTTSKITCGTWGQFLFSPTKIADAYVVVGECKGHSQPLLKTKYVANHFNVIVRQPGRTEVEGSSAPKNAAGVLSTIKEKVSGFSKWSNYRVYISVDRDIAKGSFTQWGDGYHTFADVQKCVKELMEDLDTKGAKLLGFDVSGMPNISGSDRSSVFTGSRKRQDAFEAAVKDVQFYYGLVSGYGNRV